MQQLGYFHIIRETPRRGLRQRDSEPLGFEQTRHVDLSVSGREERGVLRADIRLGPRLVHVFNTHLSTGHLERRKQAARLLDRDLLKALEISGPRIVLGDFNEWTRGLVTRTLSGEFHLTDLCIHLPRRRAYPSGLPLLSLDHIYYDHHFRVESAPFHRSRLSLIASDHLPLVAGLLVDRSGAGIKDQGALRLHRRLRVPWPGSIRGIR